MGSKKGSQSYHWSAYAQKTEFVSIPQYIELNAEKLRRKYLAFIGDLGRSDVQGKKMVEHFAIAPGFSLWWMTLLAEKSLFKSPQIVDCLKLFALENIIKQEKLASIDIVGVENRAVLEAVQVLCKNLGVVVSFNGKITRPLITRDVVSIFMHFLRGVLSFRSSLFQWPLRKTQPVPWFAGSDAVFFMSYFIHLDEERCSKGRFNSQKWAALIEKLNAKDIKCNWVHHFIRSKMVPNTRTGIKWVRSFNRNAQQQGAHAFLGSFLSVPVVFKAIVNWLRLGLRMLRFTTIASNFQAKNSAVWLWPLLKNDWYKSIIGADGAKNALYFRLFDVALSRVPQQQLGLYLSEGQAWERAFIYCWRKHGHGQLIAVAHTTIRYWDFRYLDAPAEIANQEPLAMPEPDRTAVNGPVAWRELVHVGYPLRRLIAVEALHYLDLLSLIGKKNIPASSKNSKRRLLVLGDIVPVATTQMMTSLSAISKKLASEFEIVVKSHPANPILPRDYPGLSFDLTTEPLSTILDQFDIAYGANSTSATLDAYIAGLTVIVHIETGGINLSPLRGVAGVRFVDGVADLTSALEESGGEFSEQSEEYFWLDNELPKWRGLIEPIYK